VTRVCYLGQQRRVEGYWDLPLPVKSGEPPVGLETRGAAPKFSSCVGLHRLELGTELGDPNVGSGPKVLV